MKKIKENKYLDFKYIGKNTIHFFNRDEKPIWVGYFKRLNIGQWMSWVYFLNQDCYLSGTCSDEVREVQRKLNSKCKAGAMPEIVYDLNNIKRDDL